MKRQDRVIVRSAVDASAIAVRSGSVKVSIGEILELPVYGQVRRRRVAEVGLTEKGKAYFRYEMNTTFKSQGQPDKLSRPILLSARDEGWRKPRNRVVLASCDAEPLLKEVAVLEGLVAAFGSSVTDDLRRRMLAAVQMATPGPHHSAADAARALYNSWQSCVSEATKERTQELSARLGGVYFRLRFLAGYTAKGRR